MAVFDPRRNLITAKSANNLTPSNLTNSEVTDFLPFHFFFLTRHTVICHLSMPAPPPSVDQQFAQSVFFTALAKTFRVGRPRVTSVSGCEM